MAEQAANNVVFTDDWMATVRAVTPGGGAYANEADAAEPDFKEAFYGAEHYARLLAVKETYDPTGLFYANKAVGSDAWYITDQLDGMPTQNGRLCRVAS